MRCPSYDVIGTGEVRESCLAELDGSAVVIQAFGRKAMTNLDSVLKSRSITSNACQSYSFSCSHVWM